jgi:hypothetical protein
MITMLIYGWKLVNTTRGMLLTELCLMVQMFLDGEERSRNMNLNWHITI